MVRAVKVAFLAVLALACGPAQGSPQTLSDTLSVLLAALEARVPSGGFYNPLGEVSVVCDLKPSTGFQLRVSPESLAEIRDPEERERWRRAAQPDTLPDLRAHHRDRLLFLFAERHGLAVATECDPWKGGHRDELGRPAVSLRLSGPKFDGPNKAAVYSGIITSGLSGRGGRCEWTRAGPEASWEKGKCSSVWISDSMAKQ